MGLQKWKNQEFLSPRFREGGNIPPQYSWIYKPKKGVSELSSASIFVPCNNNRSRGVGEWKNKMSAIDKREPRPIEYEFPWTAGHSAGYTLVNRWVNYAYHCVFLFSHFFLLSYPPPLPYRKNVNWILRTKKDDRLNRSFGTKWSPPYFPPFANKIPASYSCLMLLLDQLCMQQPLPHSAENEQSFCHSSGFFYYYWVGG